MAEEVLEVALEVEVLVVEVLAEASVAEALAEEAPREDGSSYELFELLTAIYQVSIISHHRIR